VQSIPRLRLDSITWRNFTICGASPDGEAPPEGQPAGSGSAAAGSGTGSAGDDEDIKDPKAKIRSLQEEKDRHFAARQQAETELNELRKEKDERERATLSDAEKTARDLETAKKTSTQLVDTNRRLSIENNFLLQNDVSWHNPAAALKLVDLSEVETSDDGTIKNPDVLKAAIAKLAKEQPYLVKAPADDEQGKRKPPPSSGSAPGGQPPRTDGLDADSLQSKYPALRAHR